MKYPILYPPDATDFFNMGQGPITTSLTATVAEERNGSFIFEAEVLTDDVIYPLLEYNAILKADAGHTLKDQRFKIKRIVPTDKGTAKIYAEHVSYLSQELSLNPEITIKSLNANAAIGRWKSSLNETNPFVVDSDITTTGSTKWRIDKVANPRQALGGVEGSLLDVYGGEYLFDNYHISLLKKRGTTANTVLAYGRNITSFEQELNITDTYTSVYPYAIYTDKNDNEQMVTIDGYVVDCENVSAFPNRVVKIVDFSNEFEHDEVPTKAKLKTLAEQYVTANDFGTPKVSIKVSFVDLSKTADYAEYQALEEVNLCDDVRVIFPKLGVNTVAKVTRTVWNVLSESYDEIEIGEKRASLSTIINDQGKQIGEAEKNANGAIIAANGKNTIFFGLYGADGLGEPVANKLGDTWYKPNGEDTETYIWNGTIWEQIASTVPDPALIALIEENKRLVEEAQSAAEDAQKAGDDAQKVADEAKDKADQAGVDAGQALDKANDAVSKANDATQKVGGLETAVGLVTEQSANAVDAANQAKGNADTALGKADSAIGTAQDALNQSALAKSQAEEAIEKYLGMGMVPAWSWSEDGTDRFTTVYPNENLWLGEREYYWESATAGWSEYTGIRPTDNGTKFTDATFVTTSFWTKTTEKLSTEIRVQVIFSKNGVRQYVYNIYVPRADAISGEMVKRTIDITEYSSEINQVNIVVLKPIEIVGEEFRISDIKIELGENLDPIYTTPPSEDYANAVPSYIGFAIEPSDNPADYTWIRNPEKVEGEVKVELTDINGELKRKVSQETFDQLNSTVINHSTLISQNQNAIKLKADQSTVDTINQTVSDHSTAIDLNAEAIALKANQSTVDSLTGRVTEAEGSITTIAGQVALKANQTVVDTLNDTVNSLNSELTVQAGKITGLTTVTDGHTTKIGALELQAGQFSLSLSSVQNDLNGLEIGGRNLIVNYDGREQSVLNNGTGEKFIYPSNSGNSQWITLLPNTKYTMSAWIRVDKETARTVDLFMVHMAATQHRSRTGIVPTTNYQLVYFTFTTSDVAEQRYYPRIDINQLSTADSVTLFVKQVKLEKGTKCTDWTPAPEDQATVTALTEVKATVDSLTMTVADKADKTTVTQLANQWQQTTDLANGHTSQISSLGDAINLRVEKDDIINQININDQGVLIAGEKVHITGLTTIDDAVIKTANIVDLNVTEAKLGNLSVSEAKIKDLAVTNAKIGKLAVGTANIGDLAVTNAKLGNLSVSGAKIQDATISSAKIINLDASKITANTLSAITTNTGALNVTGWLTFATENRGLIGTYDFGDPYGSSYNTRWYTGDYRLSHRHLVHIGKIYKVNSNDTKGSYLYDAQTYFGNDYLKMRTYNSAGTLLNRIDINSDGITMGDGEWGSNSKMALNADGSAAFGSRVNFNAGIDVAAPDGVGIRTGRIDAALNYDSFKINAERPALCDVTFGPDNVTFNGYRTSSADFTIGKDGSATNGGRVVSSMAIYNRTYSGAANMYITTAGTLGRTTSARKYKADIQPAYDAIAKAKKVLDINPSSWWDKGELADGVAKERYYGFIADEFAEAGLNEVVVYRDGEIESLAYDRIPMYHNVILSEHEKEIQELKAKVQQLENEIRVLQAA